MNQGNNINNQYNNNINSTQNINSFNNNLNNINSQYNNSASYIQPNNQIPSNNNTNIKSNRKTPKIVILIITIILIIIVGVIIYLNISGQNDGIINNNSELHNNSAKIEKYEANLNEIENSAYINELKGNILQIVDCQIILDSGVDYDLLILTKNKEIYLSSSEINSFFKLDKKFDLKQIEGILTTNGIYDTIYGDGKIYKINSDGSVNQIENNSNIRYIMLFSTNSIVGITNDGYLTASLSCQEYDKKNESRKCTNKENSIILKGTEKYKYANPNYIIDTSNNLYSSADLLTNITFNYNNLTIELKQIEKILENITSINSNAYTSDFGTFIQTSELNINWYGNGMLLYTPNSLSPKEPDSVSFKEKIVNSFTSTRAGNRALFTTNSGVYRIERKCKDDTSYICKSGYELVTTKVDELTEYKNKIKGYVKPSSNEYILLTNGRIYTLSNK